jgi:hypothetical protein
MRIAIPNPLFAWESLEDRPSLSTIRQRLASLPDAKLLEGLRQYRGRGRDDYPGHALWGVVLLRILLRHVSFEAMLGELPRNTGLRELFEEMVRRLGRGVPDLGRNGRRLDGVACVSQERGPDRDARGSDPDVGLRQSGG